MGSAAGSSNCSMPEKDTTPDIPKAFDEFQLISILTIGVTVNGTVWSSWLHSSPSFSAPMSELPAPHRCGKESSGSNVIVIVIVTAFFAIVVVLMLVYAWWRRAHDKTYQSVSHVNPSVCWHCARNRVCGISQTAVLLWQQFCVPSATICNRILHVGLTLLAMLLYLWFLVILYLCKPCLETSRDIGRLPVVR